MPGMPGTRLQESLQRLSEQYEAPDRVAGAYLLYLLTQPHTWIHRRVETAEFVDVARIRRRVSIDFTLLDDYYAESRAREALHGRPLPIPLTLLSKRLMSGFSIVNQSGDTLPMQTTNQNSHFAWSLLVAAAEIGINGDQQDDDLSRTISTELQDCLYTIVNSEPREAQTVLESITGGRNPDAVAHDMKLILSPGNGGPLFQKVARDLAENFILLVPIHAVGGGPGRFVVKLVVEEPSVRANFNLLSRIGWTPRLYRFDVPSVGECESFHFELAPPEGLFVTAIDLKAYSAAGMEVHRQTLDDPGLGHVYVSGLPPGGAKGVVSVRLRAPARGLLSTGAFTCVFSAVLLAAGALFPTELYALREQPDAAASLLLAVPAAAITLAFRQREHVLTAEVLSGARVLVLVNGLLLYLAALSLAMNGTKIDLGRLWSALTVIATGSTAVLLVALLASVRAEWLREKR